MMATEKSDIDYRPQRFGYERRSFIVKKGDLYMAHGSWSKSRVDAKIFGMEVTARLWSVKYDASIKEFLRDPLEKKSQYTERKRTKLWLSVLDFIRERNGVTVKEVMQQFRMNEEKSVYMRLQHLLYAGLLRSEGKSKKRKYYVIAEEMEREVK